MSWSSNTTTPTTWPVAETVEGKVTAYNSSNAKITVDGESYAIGAGFLRNKITADLDVDLTPDALSDLVGNDYALYLDAAGNVVPPPSWRRPSAATPW